MKNINLTRGMIALVDDDDFEWLSLRKWNYTHYPNGGYAETRLKKSEGSPNKKLIRMHTMIMNTPDGFMVDHINGNGLDNRRENLRLVTKAQNMMNRGKTRVNKSGYKGVYWEKQTGRWKAQIKTDKTNKNLGRFESREEAARAYNEAAVRYHGEFANINKIT